MDVRYELRRGLVNTLAASQLVTPSIRGRLLRWFGVQLDPSAVVRFGCYFENPRVSIGPETYINSRAHFDSNAEIRVGGRCNIGIGVFFGTSTHEIAEADRRAGATVTKPITIEDGCWIGARATILPGVTVASGCIVAAGAVVARSTEPNGLYGGVPAARLRDLP